MDELDLLIDLHRDGVRQGPGGDAETKRALDLTGLDRSRPLKVADIGCGTGASTLLLAQELDADITAVDFLPQFLDELQSRAQGQGVADRLDTLSCPMEELPFAENEFDLIWSEGAIYNMGFEAGITAWRKLLKPGGLLVVSEITWLTSTRPPELEAHWQAEYPEIDLASAKIGQLERHGYRPEAYFHLPEHCWKNNYYGPMKDRFDDFLERHANSQEAQAIVEAEKQEIALYEKHGDYYSYGVYVAKKLND